MLLNSLNEQQRAAAEQISGPVMVFAGAGSGKTRTLTYRIANMIEQGIHPSNILAITFTNKATNEMKERLYGLVGPQTSMISISTFHSLCAVILRREIKVLGYSNHFTIIDDEDQLKIIGEVLDEGNFNKKEFTAKHMRKRINNAKNFDTKLKIDIENKIYRLYEQKMKENNLLDFQDLLIKVREIFMTFPEILKRYQDRFQYILVDEFQDTDLYQYQIVKMMAAVHRNLFVVGDDDQSIYGFRGANYENIKTYKRDFPELKTIILDQNYRSTQTILDGCNNLIANNQDRESKKLYSLIPGSSNDVVVHQFRDQNEEVHYVIDQISSLLKKGYLHKDIAILYRNSAIARNFELGLIQADFKYRIFGGISYLRRKEIKDVIAYLRLIVFLDDEHSFKRVINEPGRGLGLKTVETLLAYKKEHKKTLQEAIADTPVYLRSKARALQEFMDVIVDLHDKLEQTNLVALYEELLEKTGYLEYLKSQEEEDDRIENLMEFKSILVSIEENGEIATRTEKLIAAFDQAILSDDKLANQKQSNDGITLSTVHSVKGLEFGVVFLVSLEEGLFPNLNRFDEAVDVEEERRICYVGLTRAKEKLYLTCVQNRLLYGSYRRYSQSRFLIEFLKNNKDVVIQDFEKKQEAKIDEQLETIQTNDYAIGDTVFHKVYGKGMVVSLKGDIGQIVFTEQGVIKTFDMTHPAISKVVK